MATEPSMEEIFQRLYAQAQALWGEADAEHQRQALRQAAAEIATVTRYEVPPDLEPRFF
jgi:hypothetical protein